jgi:hypothetical protein
VASLQRDIDRVAVQAPLAGSADDSGSRRSHVEEHLVVLSSGKILLQLALDRRSCHTPAVDALFLTPQLWANFGQRGTGGMA